MCEALFDPKIMSYEANRLFDDRYKDATVVEGHARLLVRFQLRGRRRNEGRVRFYEVKQQYGSRTVKAFVHGAAADIGARIGVDVQFEGRLISWKAPPDACTSDARMVS